MLLHSRCTKHESSQEAWHSSEEHLHALLYDYYHHYSFCWDHPQVLFRFMKTAKRRGSSCTVPSLGTDQEENSRLPKEKIIMSKPVKEPFRGRCGLLLAWVYEVHCRKKKASKEQLFGNGSMIWFEHCSHSGHFRRTYGSKSSIRGEAKDEYFGKHICKTHHNQLNLINGYGSTKSKAFLLLETNLCMQVFNLVAG